MDAAWNLVNGQVPERTPAWSSPRGTVAYTRVARGSRSPATSMRCRQTPSPPTSAPCASGGATSARRGRSPAQRRRLDVPSRSFCPVKPMDIPHGATSVPADDQQDPSLESRSALTRTGRIRWDSTGKTWRDGTTSRSSSVTREPPAHPHARGEHRTRTSGVLRPTGSSPRSWGTRPDRPLLGRLLRLIPTLVGNTDGPHFAFLRRSAHPHARGEHASSPAPWPAPGGSSPRSWGTHRPIAGPPLIIRLIPTLVGNTALRLRTGHVTSAHPHARGEHLLGGCLE